MAGMTKQFNSYAASRRIASKDFWLIFCRAVQ
jgi:hypothetical protein